MSGPTYEISGWYRLEHLFSVVKYFDKTIYFLYVVVVSTDSTKTVSVAWFSNQRLVCDVHVHNKVISCLCVVIVGVCDKTKP